MSRGQFLHFEHSLTSWFWTWFSSYILDGVWSIDSELSLVSKRPSKRNLVALFWKSFRSCVLDVVQYVYESLFSSFTFFLSIPRDCFTQRGKSAKSTGKSTTRSTSAARTPSWPLTPGWPTTKRTSISAMRWTISCKLISGMREVA